MSAVDVGGVHGSGRLKKLAVIISLGFLLLFAQPGRAQTNALQFYKSHFVTGDYVVGGKGLRGQGVLDTATQVITGSTMDHYATGTININGVPPNAEQFKQAFNELRFPELTDEKAERMLANAK